jgi:hypothetical protein
MNIERVAKLQLGAILVVGLAATVSSFDPVAAGGQKLAATNSYQAKDLWRGMGPPKSPTGAPPGLTIAQTKAAWSGVMTAFGATGEKHVDLKVDWDNECVLFIQGPPDNPDTKVYLKSISSDGKTTTVAAELRYEPNTGISSEVVVRPWLIASVPAAAFAGNRPVKFSIDNRDYPVDYEK